jgi:hypothetical protein
MANALDISKFEVGSAVRGRAYVREGKTVPPRYFVEGDLILIMDDIGRYANIGKEDAAILREKNSTGSGKAGIGTARTRGEVIKKLFDDGFLYKEKAKGKKSPIVMPSEKSIALYEKLSQCGTAKVLISPEMTAKWETGLTMIERGEITPAQFMDQLYKFIMQLTTDMTANPTNPYFGKPRAAAGDGTVKSNCDEKHPKDGQLCDKCKDGQLLTMKVVKKESSAFGKLYVKCDNKKCDYFGEFIKP